MNNPYQAQSAITFSDGDIKLFRLLLTLYKKYQGRDMPLSDLIRNYLTNWMVSALILVLPFGVLLWLFRDENFNSTVAFSGLAFIGGVYFGRVGRDIHHCRISTRLWPVVRQVLDWNRVDSTLETLGAETPLADKAPADKPV